MTTTGIGLSTLRERHGRSIALATVLALAVVLLCHELTEPFIGHHDWTSAGNSTFAQNHLRYGFAVTRFAMIENNDFVPPEWFRYYTNHPPLVPLIVALSFRLFGQHEWAARLVPILFSLGSTTLIYFIGTTLGRPGLGLLSALIYALLPINVYFGRMVNHEAPTNFFVLATALVYLRWHLSHRTTLFILALVVFIIGALCDWPGYYFAGLLPLHYIFTSRRGRREWKILCFPLTAIVLFGFHTAHIIWLQGSEGLLNLGTIFLYRTNVFLSPTFEALGFNPEKFTWGNFFIREIKQANELFSPLVLILAALSLYDLVRRPRGAAFSHPLFVVVLLLFGTIHLVLFSRGAWEHDYWLYYYSAAMSVLAASGALSLAGSNTDRRVLGLLGVLFVLAALPRIQSLYSYHDLRISPLALLMKKYTRPGEQILTNAPAIYNQAPQLGYYAGRDVSYIPVFQIPQLEQAFAANRKRRFAFLLLEGGEGEAQLAPWLSSRFPSQRAYFLGKPHLIFHIDPITLSQPNNRKALEENADSLQTRGANRQFLLP